MATRAVCLVSTCSLPAAASCRGLCMIHYSEAKKAVEANQTTWAELETLGLVSIKSTSFMEELKKRRDK